MRYGRMWAAVILAAALLSCRRGSKMQVDTSESSQLPREFAVEQLKELLPTAHLFACSSPKARLTSDLLRKWEVDDEKAVIPIGADQIATIRYSDVTQPTLIQYHGFFIVKLYSKETGGHELHQIWWTTEAPAKSFLQAIQKLRTE